MDINLSGDELIIELSLNLTILVEVHNEREMDRIIDLGLFSLIGINNRDLTNFTTDLSVTKTLASKYKKKLLEKNICIVSESGIHAKNDLLNVAKSGADAVLIGEALMKKENLSTALRDIMS